MCANFLLLFIVVLPVHSQLVGRFFDKLLSKSVCRVIRIPNHLDNRQIVDEYMAEKWERSFDWVHLIRENWLVQELFLTRVTWLFVPRKFTDLVMNFLSCKLQTG